MKSYTSLDQSHKLAEFLPLESADNVIVSFGDREGTKTVVMPKETFDIIRTPFDDIRNVIPCWSLAVLIEEIPEIINFDDDESDYALEILMEGGLYYLSYGNLLEHDKIEIEPQEYFVDACYEMIIKLHELNLL